MGVDVGGQLLALASRPSVTNSTRRAVASAAGVTHGPYPNAFALKDATEPVPLETTFLMLDAHNPLRLHADAASCDVPDYGDSWAASIDSAPDARPAKT